MKKIIRDVEELKRQLNAFQTDDLKTSSVLSIIDSLTQPDGEVCPNRDHGRIVFNESFTGDCPLCYGLGILDPKVQAYDNALDAIQYCSEAYIYEDIAVVYETVKELRDRRIAEVKGE